MKKIKSGFTLIELISVTVILGILTATALPKFVSLASDARAAKIQAALGSVKSASAMAHGKFLVNPVTPQLFENVSVTFVNGYPDAASIAALAGLSKDYTTTVAGTTVNAVVAVNCTASYGEAASAILPPNYVATTNGC